jgi:hypothetical protein
MTVFRFDLLPGIVVESHPYIIGSLYGGIYYEWAEGGGCSVRAISPKIKGEL